MSALNLHPGKRDVPGLGWATLTETVTLSAVLGVFPGGICGALVDLARWEGGHTWPGAAWVMGVFVFVAALAGAGLWAGSAK